MVDIALSMNFIYNAGHRRVITSSCNPDQNGVTRMAYIENTKLIPLTQGKFAIVDADDYEFLMQWRWFAENSKKNRYYARANIKAKKIRLHRLILNDPQGFQIDHINGDTLDNRRCNLRIATHSQNNQNRRKTKGRSKYKGVYFYKPYSNWRAQIQIDGVMKFIGYYPCEESAAKAYNEAALKYFGEFARLNVFTDS